MIRVLSNEAEANRFPSFENFTHDTARVWPVRVFRCRYGLYVVWFVGVVPLLDMVINYDRSGFRISFLFCFSFTRLTTTDYYYYLLLKGRTTSYFLLLKPNNRHMAFHLKKK